MNSVDFTVQTGIGGTGGTEAMVTAATAWLAPK